MGSESERGRGRGRRRMLTHLLQHVVTLGISLFSSLLRSCTQRRRAPTRWSDLEELVARVRSDYCQHRLAYEVLLVSQDDRNAESRQLEILMVHDETKSFVCLQTQGNKDLRSKSQGREWITEFKIDYLLEQVQVSVIEYERTCPLEIWILDIGYWIRISTLIWSVPLFFSSFLLLENKNKYFLATAPPAPSMCTCM